MGKAHVEHTTVFAEVIPILGVIYPQNRSIAGNDNCFMLYFQGVNVYISDSWKQETLLVIKQL